MVGKSEVRCLKIILYKPYRHVIRQTLIASRVKLKSSSSRTSSDARVHSFAFLTLLAIQLFATAILVETGKVCVQFDRDSSLHSE